MHLNKQTGFYTVINYFYIFSIFMVNTYLFSAQYTMNDQESSLNITFELGIVMSRAHIPTCGVGTLVSVGNSCAVVTAAHVVTKAASPNFIFIVIGNQKAPYKTYAVTEVIAHPEFKNSPYGSSSGLDIALLKIAESNLSELGQYFIKILVAQRFFKSAAGSSITTTKNSIHPGALKKLKQNAGIHMATPVIVGDSLSESISSGTISEFYSGASENGEIVAYQDLHTQEGFSGAPIFRIVDSTRELLAVHAGTHEDLNFRFGTLITKSIKSWIIESINKPNDNQAGKRENKSDNPTF